jgi:prepilin-type N-terminal cleavage/methylation domain-containing protein
MLKKIYQAMSLIELMVALFLGSLLSLFALRMYSSLVSYQELISRIKTTEYWMEDTADSLRQFFQLSGMDVNDGFMFSKVDDNSQDLSSIVANHQFLIAVGKIASGGYGNYLNSVLTSAIAGNRRYFHVGFNKHIVNNACYGTRYCNPPVKITNTSVPYTSPLALAIREESNVYPAKMADQNMFGFSLQTNDFQLFGRPGGYTWMAGGLRLSPVLQGAPMLEFMFRVRNPDGTIYYGRNQADMAGAWDRVEAMHIHIHAFVPRPGQGVFSDPDPYHREVQLVIPTR